MIQQTFSISSDEIVRGENFSHANEPMFTFNPARNLVYVNAACLKRLPNMEYALLVISPLAMRLSILPCDTSELDGIRLRSAGQNRNKPRQIRCRTDFADEMLSLMQWNRERRYRMIGYTAKGDRDTIIAFDLSSAESFTVAGARTDSPGALHNGFGSGFSEQKDNPLIKTITEDTEITLEDTEENINDNC